MDWQNFAKRIKALRAQRGFSQATLAKRARVSLPYISKLEQGQRRSPSFPALERIAKALGVRLDVDLR